MSPSKFLDIRIINTLTCIVLLNSGNLIYLFIYFISVSYTGINSYLKKKKHKETQKYAYSYIYKEIC